MAPSEEYVEIRCNACGWSEVCGPAEVSQWLMRANKLRRGREPDWEIMIEVLRAAAATLPCRACGSEGLGVGPPRDDVDWPERVCEACAKPISRERLDALPKTTFCSGCALKRERGQTTTEVEYCPRCGAPMAVKLSHRGGLTRYVMACTGTPPCRL